MPHLGDYSKEEKRILRRESVTPGTKKAHRVVSKLGKRNRQMTSDGYMLK